MDADWVALATILGMALVTYGTRIGGVWLMGRVRQTPRMEAWLRHIPGAVLISIVAPALIESGPAGIAGVAATALVMAKTRFILLAIAVGIAVVWLLREVLGIRG